MIYLTVPFPVTLSDLSPRFQGHGVIFNLKLYLNLNLPIDTLSVFCAQLTLDLLAIAEFLLLLVWLSSTKVFFVIVSNDELWLKFYGKFFEKLLKLEHIFLSTTSLFYCRGMQQDRASRARDRADAGHDGSSSC